VSYARRQVTVFVRLESMEMEMTQQLVVAGRVDDDLVVVSR